MMTCSLALLAAAPAGAQWCPDDVIVAVDAGGSIDVIHSNAEWNCCTGIVYTLDAHEHYLDLRESEFGWPCWCTCCFDLDVSIENVDPGEYVVRMIDDQTDEILVETRVTVQAPATAADAAVAIGDVRQSPCGGWAVGDEAPTWSGLKAQYR